MIRNLETNSFKGIVERAYPYATSLIGQLNLTPGTYSAKDIHRILRCRKRSYVQENISKADKGEMSVSKIKTGNDYFQFPADNVFYVISNLEGKAHLGGKKAHRWYIEEERECVAKSHIIFAPKKLMKQQSMMVRRYNKADKRAVVLSLADGGIRGRFANKSHFILRPEKFEKIPYKSKLCFVFTCEQLKHLYGECEIRLYQDDKRKKSKTNPHNYRIIIKNAEGWETSSDILIDSETRERMYAQDADFFKDPKPQSKRTKLNAKLHPVRKSSTDTPENAAVEGQPKEKNACDVILSYTDDNGVDSTPQKALTYENDPGRKKYPQPNYIQYIEYSVPKLRISRNLCQQE